MKKIIDEFTKFIDTNIPYYSEKTAKQIYGNEYNLKTTKNYLAFRQSVRQWMMKNRFDIVDNFIKSYKPKFINGIGFELANGVMNYLYNKKPKNLIKLNNWLIGYFNYNE
jgi:hypothetical protein